MVYRRIQITMQKYLISTALASTLCLSGTVALASDSSIPIDQIVNVVIDDAVQNYPQPAVMREGSTLVPLRGIFEALGAHIDWNQDSQTVTATKGNISIKLAIGQQTAYVNGNETPLSVRAQVINGSTMVPLRFVSEALLANVKWNSKTVTASITSLEKLPPYEAKINNIISIITTPSMPDFQKIYNIHNYVVNNVTYDRENYNKNTVPHADYTAEGALLNGTAVCEGYTLAMTALLNKVGIESKYVSTSNHAWNLVKLNGKYYHVDATWDDEDYNSPNKSPLGDVSYRYFLVSGDYIQKVDDHHFNTKWYPQADNKYDEIFAKAFPIYEGAEGMYVNRFNGKGRMDIIHINNQGDITAPTSDLEASVTYFKPVILDHFLYYNSTVSFADSPYPKLTMQRINLQTSENTIVVKDAAFPVIGGQYLIYIEPGLIPNGDNTYMENDSLHRALLDGKQDTVINQPVNSPPLITDKYIFYIKSERNSSGYRDPNSLHRVLLNGEGDTVLLKDYGIGAIVSFENGVLTYSSGKQGVPNQTLQVSP